ncbi:hypothetical protein EJ03DRAFT_178013 [Teratosphaeria nubilosa]|uniref:Uncharacterized protein n=1 Tax=Teratosphaeria nubilosa TaxID=161662 RepID=A0A6G1L0Q3_9PEZI|nr:hypothetical protein EJ03DRAFT_178013 [Teratosphaeria nubilosa]
MISEPQPKRNGGWVLLLLGAPDNPLDDRILASLPGRQASGRQILVLCPGHPVFFMVPWGQHHASNARLGGTGHPVFFMVFWGQYDANGGRLGGTGYSVFFTVSGANSKPSRLDTPSFSRSLAPTRCEHCSSREPPAYEASNIRAGSVRTPSVS